MMVRAVIAILLVLPALMGANYYVDSGATGAGTGTSWTDAWTSPLSITGVSGDDTVYISGGTTTKTYNMNTYWNPPQGTAGHPVTYKIGQESPHNGVAIFNATAAGVWLSGPRNIVVSGDAGDGTKHFKIIGYGTGVSNCITNCTVEYINASEDLVLGSFADMGGASPSGFLMQYCSAKINALDGNIAVYLGAASAAFDLNTIRYNTIEIPRDTDASGFGTDGIVCTSCTINDNVISSYLLENARGNHQDGWQMGAGGYVKIFNNTIIDMGNYALFAENITNINDVYIYNNLILVAAEDIRTGSRGGIISGVSGGCSGTCTWENYIVVGNTVVDYGTQTSISVNDANGATEPNGSCTSNCLIQNNAIINSGAIDVSGMTGITNSYNATITAANAPNSVVSYTQYAGQSNDLRPKAGDAVLINQGTTLASPFTTDKNGVARPQGAAFDIGAYEWYQLGNISGSVLSGAVVE